MLSAKTTNVIRLLFGKYPDMYNLQPNTYFLCTDAKMLLLHNINISYIILYMLSIGYLLSDALIRLSYAFIILSYAFIRWRDVNDQLKWFVDHIERCIDLIEWCVDHIEWCADLIECC